MVIKTKNEVFVKAIKILGTPKNQLLFKSTIKNMVIMILLKIKSAIAHKNIIEVRGEAGLPL